MKEIGKNIFLREKITAGWSERERKRKICIYRKKVASLCSQQISENTFYTFFFQKDVLYHIYLRTTDIKNRRT